jgi:hypothetical protein
MAESAVDPRYALFDETGTRVVCRTCGQTLALLYVLQLDEWGERYRTLVFPHDEWRERDGVWRETSRARHLRAKGRTPRPRQNPLGVSRDLGACPTRWLLSYPAVARCPGCRNKRCSTATCWRLRASSTSRAARRSVRRPKAATLPGSA